MSKTIKKAGDLAKAKGGKKPPAAKATPAVKEPAAEQVTEPASEEVTDQAAEEVADQAVEEVTDQAAEEVTEPAAEEVVEPAAEEVTEAATEEVTEPADEESSDSGEGETERILAKRDKQLAEAKSVLEIMDRCKVDEIYQNPKGEYFTVLNYAMLSVDQDRKALKHYKRLLLEVIINKAGA